MKSKPARQHLADEFNTPSSTVVPVQTAKLSGIDLDSLPYNNFKPLPIEGEWAVYATSNSTDVLDDACNPLPDETPDLSKYVTFVRRSGPCFLVGALSFTFKLNSLFHHRQTSWTISLPREENMS